MGGNGKSLSLGSHLVVARDAVLTARGVCVVVRLGVCLFPVPVTALTPRVIAALTRFSVNAWRDCKDGTGGIADVRREDASVAIETDFGNAPELFRVLCDVEKDGDLLRPNGIVGF